MSLVWKKCDHCRQPMLVADVRMSNDYSCGRKKCRKKRGLKWLKR